MAENQDKLAQFCQITGKDANAAKFFLEAANWDLDAAVSNSLDASTPSAASPSPKPAEVPPTQGNAPVMNPPKKQKTGNSGFMGISDFNKGNTGDPAAQNYFAGGSQNSGVAIQGPPDSAAIVKDVFENAKKKGAVNASDFEKEEKPKFDGTGYRLGHNPAEASKPIVPPPSNKPKRVVKVLTFWKNGFTVDDGPLRRFDDPKNKQFLSDVNDGVVPREIEAEVRGQELHVELKDEKTRDYVEPEKPKYIAYGGSGMSLGSSSPSPNTSNAPVALPADFELKIDESKPTTRIQIRLHNGKRLAGKFNLTTTLQEVKFYVMSKCDTGGRDFELRTAFPPAALSDLTLTLEAAGLKNASVVQKLL